MHPVHQNGRETLENAIHMVEANPEWKARVVYGDTDSMFVLLAGRSRADAHRIGNEIAAAVTAANPSPVTLKMEKASTARSCLLAWRLPDSLVAVPSQQSGKHVKAVDAPPVRLLQRLDH